MNFIDTPEFAEQRRAFLRHTGLSLAALGASGPLQVLAQNSNTLTIAYNVSLPSWDPTVSPRPSTRPYKRFTKPCCRSTSTRTPT